MALTAVIVILIIALILANNWQSKQLESSGSTEKITIAASTYVLQEFVKHIGGEHIELTDLGNKGTGDHDFEPSPRVVGSIVKADLLIYHGLGLDQWAEKLAAEVEEQGGATVEATALISQYDLIKIEEDEHEGEGEEGEGEEGEHGDTDPHTWLDPVLMQTVVRGIQQKLSDRDTAHAADFEQNASALIAQLEALHTDFTTAVSACSLKTIVVAHDAFQYLGKRYGLVIHPIAGVFPEAEPSLKRLAELSLLVEKEGIKYIFFETLTSPKLSETLASEVGAQTLVLNPVEGLTAEQIETGSTYFTVMQENLENLQTALSCSAQ